MTHVENERDSDEGRKSQRARGKQRGWREDREEGGHAAANLTFIMCHHAMLLQPLHAHTR